MSDVQSLLATGDALLNRLAQGGPMNFARAQEVMERFGIDGIVVGEPLNVFHMTGYYPQIGLTRLGHPPTTLAILKRGEPQPVVVTSHFIFYYSFADGDARAETRAYLFEAADDVGDAQRAQADPAFFASWHETELTNVEHRRRNRTDQALSGGTLFERSGAALAEALRDLGLWNATLAYDHDVIRAVCERRGWSGALIPGDNILRWIRIVKSPLEIELMKQGATANALAVEAAVAAVREGASYRDIRRQYEIELAKRGNRPVFMTIDRVSSPLPGDYEVREGQSLFLDGVSHFSNYHGDYARTVFVGEPSKAARSEADIAVRGWEAIRENLKPGMRYAEVSAVGRAVLEKTGAASSVTFGPHSCGLMHTDEPASEMGGFYGKQDLVLEENMVLSVDCPSLATGIGGSVHIEDLVLITADGAVPIHPIGAHVITI
jgi:Xaa-Pro aminopeptidase